jgi:DNA-binding PadR family transcriptional regulator
MATLSNEFIRGTIKTIILKLLAQNKKMYGYEITQRVSELSKNEINLSYGALYPVLYKLESEGLLLTTTEVVDGRVRKYYALTSEGKKMAKEKVSQLQEFNRILSSILSDSSLPKTSLKSSIV